MPEMTTTTDKDGRILEFKVLDLMEEMDLIEAAGSPTPPDRWMQYATLAATVRSINGVPRPYPTNRKMIRDQVQVVGSAGVSAVIAALASGDLPETVVDALTGENSVAKNSAGTPTSEPTSGS